MLDQVIRAFVVEIDKRNQRSLTSKRSTMAAPIPEAPPLIRTTASLRLRYRAKDSFSAMSLGNMLTRRVFRNIRGKRVSAKIRLARGRFTKDGPLARRQELGARSYFAIRIMPHSTSPGNS
jgi:hypothetical protein